MLLTAEIDPSHLKLLLPLLSEMMIDICKVLLPLNPLCFGFVLLQVEEGWWEGILNGKTGMFPSNFIKELSDSDDAGIAQEEQVKPSKESRFS